jgi:DNA-binding response OmpR family regulator
VAALASVPAVLVLDDEKPIREMGRRFLEKAGYGCVEADSIDAALDALSVTPVVAAILDVRLPGTHSGLDMLEAFREIDEFKTIPILIMTGSILTEAEQAVVTRHRAVLFYKPEGFSTIVGFLDQLTGRDRSH